MAGDQTRTDLFVILGATIAALYRAGEPPSEIRKALELALESSQDPEAAAIKLEGMLADVR